MDGHSIALRTPSNAESTESATSGRYLLFCISTSYLAIFYQNIVKVAPADWLFVLIESRTFGTVILVS